MHGPGATDEDRRASAALVDAPLPTATSDAQTDKGPVRHRLAADAEVRSCSAPRARWWSFALAAVATSFARTGATSAGSTPSATASWRAVESVAADPPAVRQGTTAPTAIRYSGSPPTQIVVRSSDGIRWTLTVAFLE